MKIRIRITIEYQILRVVTVTINRIEFEKRLMFFDETIGNSDFVICPSF